MFKDMTVSNTIMVGRGGKCIKVVGNKTIYNSYAQHGMQGIKRV
jgi:hypothetical protein